MTLDATKLRDYGTTRITATAAGQGGDVIQLPDGRAGVVQGTGKHAVGDEIAVEYVGEYRFKKAAATTFSAGATVNYNTSTKLVVTTGGIVLGRAIVAGANGPEIADVRINDQDATT